jgi:SnoaL-like domain
MSPNDARAERLSQAIVAAISGDVNLLNKLFTHDVVGSGPALSVSDRAELTVEIGGRDHLTDVEIALSALDVSGDQACVEWVLSGERPGGRSSERVRVRAITVAEFDGDQICSFRSYWDDTSVLDQIGARGTH